MDNRKKILSRLGMFALLAISLLGAYKTIFFSADIDESYAVTLGIRIARGDRMFKDMWEIHQTSAVLYAPFIALFEWVTAGVEGLLIYLRTIGILIQGGVAVYAFCVFRKMVHPYLAVCVAFIYFNFTPKHIQSPEFTQYLYWGMMVLCLSLLQFLHTKKYRYLVVTALSLCVCILAYPYAILLFLVLVIFFIVMLRQDVRGTLKSALLVFGGTCAVCGAIFLIYVLSGISPGELWGNVSYVLMDESHSQSMLLKFKEHFLSIWDMSKVTLLIIILTHVSRKVYGQKYKKDAKPVLAMAFFAEAVWFIVQFHTITKVNFTIFLPLIFQLFLLLLYAYKGYEKNDKLFGYGMEDTVNLVNTNSIGETNGLIFGAMVIPSLAGGVIVLISSNLTANYSTGFLMPALCGLIVCVGNRGLLYNRQHNLEKDLESSSKKLIWYGFVTAVSVFVMLTAVNRVFLVRFTSTQRKNIFEGYYETNHGPLKGIKLGEVDYRQYEAKTGVLAEQVTEEDVFLYVGCDMFLYSLCEGEIGTGNTISTPAFGNQLLAYYEKYPEKMPTVMFVDREYVGDFTIFLTEEPFKSFVEENYRLDENVINVPVNVYRLAGNE